MTGESKATFLRQSGWLSLATAISGVAAYAVHFFAREMPKADYGVFTTMLQLINLLAIPGIGLQTVFAQKFATVDSSSEKESHRDRAAVISLWMIVWFVIFCVAIISSSYWVKIFQLDSSLVLLLTIATGLFALILPLEFGVQQGRQKFSRLGWAILLLGVVRFSLIPVLFWINEPDPFWGMFAVLVGFAVAYLVASWSLPWPKSKSFFRGTITLLKSADWKDLLKRFIPLSLGGGAVIFMMSVDMVIVQQHFDKDQTGLYAATGMIGRALIFLVGPMVAVMFPKIVRSHAEQKPTDVLKVTLLLTTGLCVIAGALGIMVPKLPLEIIYDESYLPIAPLVPWFIWAMVPLALSAVLVNNLLARKFFTVVYGLVGVCVLYAGALWIVSPGLAAQTQVFNVQSYIGVAQTIGLGNLAFLAVAAGFTWWHHPSWDDRGGGALSFKYSHVSSGRNGRNQR